MIRKIRGGDQEPEINLTPLIDIVFVILIMFILVAPILEVERVELAVAGGNDRVEPLKSQSPVAVQVRSDDSIWLSDRRIALADLSKDLKELHARYPQVVPQLFLDQKAHFGVYQGVKNAMESAGWSELQLVLEPGGRAG